LGDKIADYGIKEDEVIFKRANLGFVEKKPLMDQSEWCKKNGFIGPESNSIVLE
jgi:hypothetical protein